MSSYCPQNVPPISLVNCLTIRIPSSPLRHITTLLRPTFPFFYGDDRKRILTLIRFSSLITSFFSYRSCLPLCFLHIRHSAARQHLVFVVSLIVLRLLASSWSRQLVDYNRRQRQTSVASAIHHALNPAIDKKRRC